MYTREEKIYILDALVVAHCGAAIHIKINKQRSMMEMLKMFTVIEIFEVNIECSAVGSRFLYITVSTNFS